ncbi:MAG: hypothetical protein ACFFAO_04705 [Candidatus Hermodarchaeota archaeon]
MVESYLELKILYLVLGIIASIIMGYDYIKRRDLLYWLLAYIVVTIGFLFNVIDGAVNPGEESLIGNIFYTIAIFIVFYTNFNEYYRTFIPSKGNGNKFKKSIIVVMAINPFLIGLEVVIITVSIISIVLLLRIFWVKRTPTHGFLSLALVSSTTTIIMTALESLGIEGLTLLNYGNSVIFTTLLVVTALVAFAEQKIIETQNDKDTLKDTYSHNLGNILHSITLAYELIDGRDLTEKDINDLSHLLKEKTVEAADLIKEIRKL